MGSPAWKGCNELYVMTTYDQIHVRNVHGHMTYIETLSGHTAKIRDEHSHFSETWIAGSKQGLLLHRSWKLLETPWISLWLILVKIPVVFLFEDAHGAESLSLSLAVYNGDAYSNVYMVYACICVYIYIYTRNTCNVDVCTAAIPRWLNTCENLG